MLDSSREGSREGSREVEVCIQRTAFQAADTLTTGEKVLRTVPVRGLDFLLRRDDILLILVYS